MTRTFIEWCRATFGTDPLIIEADVPQPIAIVPPVVPKEMATKKLRKVPKAKSNRRKSRAHP